MRQYELFEISLHGKEPGDDWVHMDIEAEFRIGAKVWNVKGFYAGTAIKNKIRKLVVFRPDFVFLYLKHIDSKI